MCRPLQIAFITADPLPSDAAAKSGCVPLIAGRSVLQHQVEVALRHGCERVVCLAQHPPRDFDKLRRMCSEAGASLRLLHRPRELSALVSASDILLVFAKNLLFEEDMLPRRDKDLPVILALPAEGSVALGFERIDATRAWAGIMLLPGALVEELRRLPDDIDPASALLRVGLMARTPIVELPINVLARHAIALPLDPAGARRIEAERINRLAEPASFSAPCRAVVERLAIRNASQILATRFGGRALGGAAGMVLLLANFAGQAGYTALALCAFIMASAQITAWQILRRVSGWTKAEPRKRDRLGSSANIAADVTLLVILAQAGSTGTQLPVHWFAPAVLIGLLGLARRLLPEQFAALASDRALIGAALLLAHGVGVLSGAVMILALAVLATLFVYETRRTEITTD